MYVEPVYLSSHFDLETQEIKDPIHLDQLIKELKLNDKFFCVEKELLPLRLLQMKKLGVGINKEDDIQNIIRDIHIRNKDNKNFHEFVFHNYPEMYKKVDEIAENLYMFISREEVQKL